MMDRYTETAAHRVLLDDEGYRGVEVDVDTSHLDLPEELTGEAREKLVRRLIQDLAAEGVTATDTPYERLHLQRTESPLERTLNRVLFALRDIPRHSVSSPLDPTVAVKGNGANWRDIAAALTAAGLAFDKGALESTHRTVVEVG